MPDAEPSPSSRYRVTTYVWGGPDDEEPAVCELVEMAQVEAEDVAAATVKATFEHVPPGVDRLVIDVQRADLPVTRKASQWGPWRSAVAWLDGVQEHVDHLRACLERRTPVSIVAVDGAGCVGVAAALPGHLDGEATLDLEEILAAALEEVGIDLNEILSSTVESPVRSERPSVDELRAELLGSTESDLHDAVPTPPAHDVVEVEPEPPQQAELICELLLKIAGGGSTDLEALASELGFSTFVVEEALASIDRWRLALTDRESGPPMLLDAGRQFLARRGHVPRETLDFLASPLDDLNAREALRRAGFILLDDLTEALEQQSLVEHAQDVVPPAFREAVDQRLAVRLYAAASALMARLSDGSPAGCVAEEILAVRLLQIAEALIEDREDDLGRDAAQAAVAELRGLFELFEDDDVLDMFDMSEPGGAALAGHDDIKRQMGVADQRVEAWFEPFGWTTPTGHLDERTSHRWP